MVNLTEILQKELRNGEKTVGIAESLLFDNFAGTCMLQTQDGIFIVDKVTPRWNYVDVALRAWQNQQLTARTEEKQFLQRIEIGQKIYNQNGVAMGEIVDVELTSKFVIQRLLTSCGRYLKRCDIAAVGDAVIAKAKSATRKVSDELRKERALEQPNEQTTERATEQGVADKEVVEQINDEKAIDNHTTVESVQIAQNVEQNADVATTDQTSGNGKRSNVIYFSYGQTELTNSESGKPARRVSVRDKTMRRKYGDFSFLVGKSVDKTMFNFQGEVMIKQHETITWEVLRQAKIAGKLLELYLHIE